MTMNSAFVDPSTLSLPSPQSDASDSPRLDHAELAPGPSRKRARTEMSADERKEARAHRNRIAAQNSRDKRKAQFSVLERRVAELEDENRQLRAGMSVTDLQRADDRRYEEMEREKERDRENSELKERIKSLEKGWEAVMKVLAAQGVPSGALSSGPAPPSPPSTNSPTTFPVFVPSSPVLPITPSPSTTTTTIVIDADEESTESTRHLARVASDAAIPPASALQRVDSSRLNNLLNLSPSLCLPRRPASSRSSRIPARRQRTRLPWMPGSAKSSRHLPACRRVLFLLRSSKSSARRR